MKINSILIVFLTSVLVTGCAGITKLHGEYNPEKYPSSELATIFEKKRSFGQKMLEQTYYKILATNGATPGTVHDGFSKFAPGVHFIDWVYVEMLDTGFGTSHEVRSSGRLLVELEKASKYRLGKKDSETEVSVWNEETDELVSSLCKTDCRKEKSDLSGVPPYLSN
jgi:hypothetical protein